MIIAFAKRARDYDFTAQWYANKLQAMGILREDLDQIIRDNWPEARKELSRVMEQAGFKSLNSDERIYQRAVKAGLIPAAPPISE
ncbi:MAG: phage minor capsid protein, partial [Citrobacter braakii]